MTRDEAPANRVPIEGIFGALRDGYRFEVQQLCRHLRSQVEGEGGRRAPGVVASANEINRRMGDWLADLPRRLEHDLTRASREVLADALTGKADVDRVLAEFLSEHRPPPFTVKIDPLLLPPSRAMVPALRSGSGTAIVLWVVSTLLVPEPWRNSAYLLSVLVGLSSGLWRFQQRQVKEGEHWRRLIAEHLERTSLRVAAAIEGYVVDWVQTFAPFLRTRGGHVRARDTSGPGSFESGTADGTSPRTAE